MADVLAFPDVLVIGHPGSTVYLFEPVTDAAKEWVEENLALEGWQWMAGAFAVEHRYVGELAIGMMDSGLILKRRCA